MTELVPGVEYQIVPLGPGMTMLEAAEAVPCGAFVFVDARGRVHQYRGPRLVEADVAITSAGAGERIVVRLRHQVGYQIVAPPETAGQFLHTLPRSPWRMMQPGFPLMTVWG